MDMEQSNIWDYDDDENELGCCHKCGKIGVEVFTSVKDGKTYCLNGCDEKDL